jgi:flagellar biosynthesis/type III secretory pathway M-ring protein FliF/YscJ
VANSIGLNGTRGDQITVNAIAFNHSTDIAAQNALRNQQQQSQIAQIARNLALALAAAALLFFAWQATRRRDPRIQAATVSLVNEVRQMEGPDGAPIIEIMPQSTPVPVGASEQTLLMTSQDPSIAGNMLAVARQRQMTEFEQARTNEIRQGLMEITKQHPEMIANVVQGWFDE